MCSPCSHSAALLQRLSVFNRQLLIAPDVGSGVASVSFAAACLAIHGCAELSDHLPFQRSDAFRLASTLEVVFGAGLRLLRHHASTPAGSDTELADRVMDWERQLRVASQVLRRTDPRDQPDAAAAFARTTGRPQAVLPWLLAVSQALLSLPPDLEGRIRQYLDSALPGEKASQFVTRHAMPCS